MYIRIRRVEIYMAGRILLKVKRSIYDVTHAVVNIVFGMNLRSWKGYTYMLVMISFYYIHLLENILCFIQNVVFHCYFDH